MIGLKSNIHCAPVSNRHRGRPNLESPLGAGEKSDMLDYKASIQSLGEQGQAQPMRLVKAPFLLITGR